MKLIDLLNKISNGGEVPKKVKFAGIIFEYDEDDQMYNDDIYRNICNYAFLNDEVEIIEEEPKVQVELTEKEYLECLNKINKNIKIIRDYIPKPSFLKLEEEKKIPEKIKDKYCSQISKIELAQKYNEIIDYLDYLKSKGK